MVALAGRDRKGCLVMRATVYENATRAYQEALGERFGVDVAAHQKFRESMDAVLRESLKDILRGLLAAYEREVYDAYADGLMARGTYDVRTYNAERFIRWATDGELNIRRARRAEGARDA